MTHAIKNRWDIRIVEELTNYVSQGTAGTYLEEANALLKEARDSELLEAMEAQRPVLETIWDDSSSLRAPAEYAPSEGSGHSNGVPVERIDSKPVRRARSHDGADSVGETVSETGHEAPQGDLGRRSQTDLVPSASSACTSVDIIRSDGSILQGSKITCGPKDVGAITTSNFTLRFTQDLWEIGRGVFPERVLALARIQRVDFQPFNLAEDEAVRQYYARHRDHFDREWHRASVTFWDGTVWDRIYVYDKCSYLSALEEGTLDALKPAALLFTRTPTCD
jgi:hypothetical protein